MKKTLLSALFLTLPVFATAETYVQADLGRVSADIEVDDAKHFLLGGTLGYNFNPGEQFQNKVEAFASFGLNDDKVSGVDIKVEHFYGVAYRPTLKLNQDWDIYARLVYAKARAKASFRGNSASQTSDWEAGYGLGVSYKNFNLSYTDVNDLDLDTISLGYTFEF